MGTPHESATEMDRALCGWAKGVEDFRFCFNFIKLNKIKQCMAINMIKYSFRPIVTYTYKEVKNYFEAI